MLPKDFRFEPGGAKLASGPGCYLTSLRPCLKVKTNESTIPLGDLNAHVGNDVRVWSGVIPRQGDADVNFKTPADLNDADINDKMVAAGRPSIFNYVITTHCASKTLSSNTDIVPNYTWCRDFLGQSSLIDFCIVSVDLFLSVLEVCVKMGEELSTDRHLLICNLHMEKSLGPTQMCRARRCTE